MDKIETTYRTGLAISRRSVLACLAGGMTGAIAADNRPRPKGKTLRIGTTFDNSSVEIAYGSGLYQGSAAYFNAVNRAGGINGAKVELVMADDQFKPDISKTNALAFAADPTIVALLHPLGTRQTAAVMDAVQDMAVVGPSTGTYSLRTRAAPNVFWVRASYNQEVEKLIETAVTLGTTRIGFVHPNDPLGQSVLAAFNTSCEKFNLKPVVIATTPNTGSTEVAPAAEAIAKAAPQLVIMCLAGSAPAFVRELRKAGGNSSIYGLSLSATAGNIRDLGELSRGLGFSIVTPSPFVTKHELVRRYQADMKSNGTTDFSLPSLEGYLDARVLAEGLRRAGAVPTRQSLMAALEGIEALDLGGVNIGYGKGIREGNKYVAVAVVGTNGRLMS